MLKLSELVERRAAVVDKMKQHSADGGADYDAAAAELETLDGQITRARTLDAAERRETGRPLTRGDGLLSSELRNFNLSRAIAGQIAPGTVDDGFEREMQVELAKRAGRAANGLFIPMEIFELRTLTAAGDGAALVPTDQRPELFIDALTSATMVRQLGATVLSGLSGNVDIPREVAAPAVGWVAENQALTAGEAEFDSVTLSPKHAGALSQYSRNMILQSSPAVEMLLRKMMARDLGLAIDRAAIMGGGTNEPDGILSTAGIQEVAFATDIFTTAADMIGAANVANVGANRAFLGTTGIQTHCMKVKDGNDLPIPLAAQFHNATTAFSNLVPATLGTGDDEHGLIYGDWSELIIGIWSEVDILVNPYEATAYSKGNVSIRAMATVDMALRNPTAFVSATGVTFP